MDSLYIFEYRKKNMLTLSTLPPSMPPSRPSNFFNWLRVIAWERKKIEAKRGKLPYEDAPEPYGLTQADIIRSNFPRNPLESENHVSFR